MSGYDIMVKLIMWAVSVGGGAILIFGVFKVMQSLGENGTGTDRTTGIMSALGGVAAIALAQVVPFVFPAPPGF